MRRIILLVLLRACAAAPAAADERGAAQELARIRHQPALMNQFLWNLPKGGDIHMHLFGAVYAENLIRYGAESRDCVDLFTFAASPPRCMPGQRPLRDALSENDFQNQVVHAWSMKGFVPAHESGHDHFFATFGKFGVALDGHDGDGLATVARRAQSEHVEYLEVLVTLRFAQTGALAARVGYTPNFLAMRRRLLAAGIRKLVPLASRDLSGLLAQKRRADPSPDPVIRFDVQVLRANPPAIVFAQMLLGFELMRADHRWVGINLVQPGDDITALDDYLLQMRMLRYLHHVYPVGHMTLHAGELAPGLAPPNDLRFHIRAAVEIAGAERIGHGVDIEYERDPIWAAARDGAQADLGRGAARLQLPDPGGVRQQASDRPLYPLRRTRGARDRRRRCVAHRSDAAVRARRNRARSRLLRAQADLVRLAALRIPSGPDQTAASPAARASFRSLRGTLPIATMSGKEQWQ